MMLPSTWTLRVPENKDPAMMSLAETNGLKTQAGKRKQRTILRLGEASCRIMTRREYLYRVATPLKSDSRIDNEPLCSTWFPYKGLFAVSLCSQDERRGSQSSPMPRSGWMKPTRMGGRARGVLVADAALTGCRSRGAIVVLRSRVGGSRSWLSEGATSESLPPARPPSSSSAIRQQRPQIRTAWQQQAQDEFRRSVRRPRIPGIRSKDAWC